METKNVYRYDDKNYFEHKVILDDTDRSPVSGAWQIPAYCTEVEPPAEKEGFKIKWTGSEWEYEAEEKEPEPPKPTFEELKKRKVQELKWERDRKEVEPIVYNGKLYDYDDKARDRINAAIIALDLQGEKATISCPLSIAPESDWNPISYVPPSPPKAINLYVSSILPFFFKNRYRHFGVRG